MSRAKKERQEEKKKKSKIKENDEYVAQHGSRGENDTGNKQRRRKEKQAARSIKEKRGSILSQYEWEEEREKKTLRKSHGVHDSSFIQVDRSNEKQSGRESLRIILINSTDGKSDFCSAVCENTP